MHRLARSPRGARARRAARLLARGQQEVQDAVVGRAQEVVHKLRVLLLHLRARRRGASAQPTLSAGAAGGPPRRRAAALNGRALGDRSAPLLA